MSALARSADVVVESFRPGYLAGLGLDYAALAHDNPRLVMTSITPFGQNGPLRKLPGYDSIFPGLGGLMAVTGHPDDEPGGGPQKVGLIASGLLAGT